MHSLLALQGCGSVKGSELEFSQLLLQLLDPNLTLVYLCLVEVDRLVELFSLNILLLAVALVEPLVHESLPLIAKLSLHSCNLLLELSLIESLLSHDLTAEVLELASQTLLDGITLLAHNLPPDSVEFVKDFRDARLRDLASSLVYRLSALFDVVENSNGLSGDPVVV